jgi:hypothetical protein
MLAMTQVTVSDFLDLLNKAFHYVVDLRLIGAMEK